MSLLNGPDVAGVLDAIGKKDAAETLRWSQAEQAEQERDAELADLEDQLAELIRENERLENELGAAKVEADAMRPVVEAAKKLATEGTYSGLLDLCEAASKYTKEQEKK